MYLSTYWLFVVLISLSVFEASNVPTFRSPACQTHAGRARLTTDNANPKGALAHSQTRIRPRSKPALRPPQVQPPGLPAPLPLATKLVLLHTLVDHDRQIAPNGVHHRYQALRRSVHQEQQLGVDLL